MPRSDWQRVEDIYEHGLRVASMMQGVEPQDFVEGEQLRVTVTHYLQIMGEAARTVSHDLRDRLPQMPWRRMINIRNTIVHRYDNVELDPLWDFVMVDLPSILELLHDALEQAKARGDL